MELLDAVQIKRHRLTVEQYHRMVEAGVIAPDARVELIEGNVIEMAPIGRPPSRCCYPADSVARAGIERSRNRFDQAAHTAGRHDRNQARPRDLQTLR